MRFNWLQIMIMKGVKCEMKIGCERGNRVGNGFIIMPKRVPMHLKSTSVVFIQGEWCGECEMQYIIKTGLTDDYK